MATKTDATHNRTRTVYGYYRVSSEQQNWGDGERRQDQQLKDLCARKGWTLSDRRFSDKGVSAWQGRNRREGALGELLKISKPGDVIAIEDSDRFSRERTMKSLAALEQIVNRDITIYFVKSGIEVTKENFNNAEVLFPCFFQAFLANQENEKRAYRIRSAMESKRQQIEAGRLIFGRLPCWLRWNLPPKNPDRVPVIVAEKANVVKKVFDLYLEGKGVATIAQIMCGVPPISNSKRSRWNSTFVWNLLRDRSVVGEHAPSKTPKIFPAIISEGDFLRVAEKMIVNKHHTVRARVANSNLFSGLARCSVCGHTLTRQTATCGTRRYQYLVCGGRLRHMEGCRCNFHSVNYTDFEASFLSLLGESGVIHKLLSNDKVASPVENLKLKLADVQTRADQLVRVLEESAAGEGGRIAKRVKVLEAEETQIQQQIDAALAVANAEVPARNAFDRFACELARHANEPEGRACIRNSLRDFIDRIEVELGHDVYHVHLKGADQTIEVALNKHGWTFSPAALWAVEKNVYEKMSAAGELVNCIT